MTDAPTSATPAARPLKILIGADTFAPEINGSATFSASLAGGLKKRGHDVRVVAPGGYRRQRGLFTEQHGGAEVPVYRLWSWRYRPHPWLRFAFPWRIQSNSARILDEFKPDVVHIQSNINVGRGLSEQALKRNIRLIATNHVMPENLLEFSLIPRFAQILFVRWSWWDADRVYSRAEAMTTPTRRAADYLEQNTSIKGVLAISCGLDASVYTPNFAKRIDNLIMFVGRVTGEKQIDKLISAFAKLDPSLDARLEIVGGGELESELKLLATRLGVIDRIQFDSYVSTEFLRAALTRATVFAMPSIAELQSIATMEAMASGLPIVGANAMALPHLVHNGENGYLFEPGNIDEFAARLTDVLRMPEDKLQEFKKESLRIVQAHDINRTLDTFEALYRGESVVEPIIDVSQPIRDRIRERILRLRATSSANLARARKSRRE